MRKRIHKRERTNKTAYNNSAFRIPHSAFDKFRIPHSAFDKFRIRSMTNEMLAEFIGEGGNDELIPVLWDKVKKFVYMRADNYFRVYKDHCKRNGVEACDIRQEGYIAFSESLRGFSSGKGSYISYLDIKLKEYIRGMFVKDPINTAESMELILENNGDVIPDKSTSATDRIEDESVRRVINEAVGKLGKNEMHVINLHYYENYSLSKIAALLNISTERVRCIRNKALEKLYSAKELCRLFDDLGYSSRRIYANQVEYIACVRADILRKTKEELELTQNALHTLQARSAADLEQFHEEIRGRAAAYGFDYGAFYEARKNNRDIDITRFYISI